MGNHLDDHLSGLPVEPVNRAPVAAISFNNAKSAAASLPGSLRSDLMAEGEKISFMGYIRL